MKYYCEEKDLVMRQLDSGENGLSQAEAERRLAENGKNKLAAAKKDSILKQLLKQLADPMIIILLAAAAISGVLAVSSLTPFWAFIRKTRRKRPLKLCRKCRRQRQRCCATGR